MGIYLSLTRAFNEGALRAILSSGQAVVVHRLALMSKDGDWILRERPEALHHVLEVLEKRGARYRFGAPLDVRWMEGGWSSHLEFSADGLRVRTDFVTRPPRLSFSDLSALWREIEGADLRVVDPRRLAELKKTNREKDYAVIGELARLLSDPRDRFMLSRSARDLVTLGRDHPDLVSELLPRRPLLGLLDAPITDLEAALDSERRALPAFCRSGRWSPNHEHDARRVPQRGGSGPPQSLPERINRMVGRVAPYGAGHERSRPG